MKFKPGDIVQNKFFGNCGYVLSVIISGPYKLTPSEEPQTFYSYRCRVQDNSIVVFDEFELEKVEIT